MYAAHLTPESGNASQGGGREMWKSGMGGRGEGVEGRKKKGEARAFPGDPFS